MVWPFQITKHRSNKHSCRSLKKRKEKWKNTYTCIIVLESPTSPPSPIVRESYPISKSNSSKLIWMTWRRRSRFYRFSFTVVKDFINGIQFWKKVRLRSKNRLFVSFFFVSNKKVKAFLESARLRLMFNRTITAKEKLKTFLPHVWCRTKLKHSKFLWFMEELQRNLNSNSSHEFFEKCCDKHFTGSDSRPKTHLSRQKKKKDTVSLHYFTAQIKFKR